MRLLGALRYTSWQHVYFTRRGPFSPEKKALSEQGYYYSEDFFDNAPKLGMPAGSWVSQYLG